MSTTADAPDDSATARRAEKLRSADNRVGLHATARHTREINGAGADPSVVKRPEIRQEPVGEPG
jgi:hypothetical protein